MVEPLQALKNLILRSLGADLAIDYTEENVEDLLEKFDAVVHFWAPTFKWGLTIANILDSSKPPEDLSYAQQSVLACSGLIWARYSTLIKPKNWNLVSVNLGMSLTALFQLSRKIQHDSSAKNQQASAEEE
ncbi:unnamed protein product [Prunus armeniaca]|uniref:Mitochondrial pyruvate carrier n=1 Tax=Prunus armeniaca TaxID=36596 RepID=A0A6J5UIW7_PRUAR|nr:unnamed protein product [Prunus armeniaca]